MSIPTTFLPLMAFSLFMASAPAADQPIDAINIVSISENLVTAGQPTPESLAGLSALGFQAVIYLAPPTVHGAVANEADIVRSQGMEFINIPIQWSEPTEDDFHSFVEAMNRLQGQKVLVHCQANMRASAMTFLYRVIEAGENPSLAYEAVQQVWTPEDQWKEFVNAQLQKANISFEID